MFMLLLCGSTADDTKIWLVDDRRIGFLYCKPFQIRFFSYSRAAQLTRHLSTNYFTTAGLNYIVFTTYSPSNPGHLSPCTLDNAGTTWFYQISDVNLINATLLLAHFLITSNISCVLCVPMSMYFVILFYFLLVVL